MTTKQSVSFKETRVALDPSSWSLKSFWNRLLWNANGNSCTVFILRREETRSAILCSQNVYFIKWPIVPIRVTLLIYLSNHIMHFTTNGCKRFSRPTRPIQGNVFLLGKKQEREYFLFHPSNMHVIVFFYSTRESTEYTVLATNICVRIIPNEECFCFVTILYGWLSFLWYFIRSCSFFNIQNYYKTWMISTCINTT